MSSSGNALSDSLADASQLALPYWRLVGPHRGGRVVAVAGHPTEAGTFYFGSTGGGVWKTTDAGLAWRNVSDGFFNSASVGAIAVATSDPNVVYAGMGETTIRGNISFGDGVYRTTDGGKAWQHLGLADTRHIAKIRVHPNNPDLVYVAALGHAFGANDERGVYRSRDGGQTWERVLYRDDRTGAIDLVLDETNPRILYAALWQTRRGPHYLSSGGPGSGLFKSVDGGDTWDEITDRPGLPGGLRGKIGIAASPANPDRVWALIEAEGGSGLYRSDNGGSSWKLVSDENELRHRPWYYMHVFADPQDPERVWILNLRCWRSTDGGRNFVAVDSPHVDNHDLWIDPKNPQRMINGSDGGACVSYNGGISWSTLHNQPTAEMYHVTTDTQIPYRVYGPQQDNTGISVPSFSTQGAITLAECYEPGGGECGYMAVRPDDPNIVFGGSVSATMTRYDHRSAHVYDITVWPDNQTGHSAQEHKYRFQWTFPIALSPHDPDTLYAAGNHLFRSQDEGWNWEPISPDLTRADPATLGSSGGPITLDNVNTETYATIFAFAESPVTPGVLWTGSDDGLIHISCDGGENWDNVSIPDLADWALISIIEASPHDAGTAYVAATRYKLDDPAPYLFKTGDYGQTWTKIVDGIRADDYTRSIREDPVRAGLLYAGAERGVYVSFDDGDHWEPLRGNLPVVPVHDLHVKDTDLIAATHGRSFWILDDVTPLREWTDMVATSDAHLFHPRPGYRFKVYWGAHRGLPTIPSIPDRRYASTGILPVRLEMVEQPTGELAEEFFDAGKNPPVGVVVNYYLGETPDSEVSLTFFDREGQKIRTFSSDGETKMRPTGNPGLNRFVWDMRYPDATALPGAVFWQGGALGPLAVPGEYTVELRVGDQTRTESFEVRSDPRVPTTQEDLEAQFALHSNICNKLSETHEAIARIRGVREQVERWKELSLANSDAQPLAESADEIIADLTSIEEELINPGIRVVYDALKLPIKLNNRLACLIGVVATSDSRPTRQMSEVFDGLAGEVDEQLARLQNVIDQDVNDYNKQVREMGLPAVSVRQ